MIHLTTGQPGAGKTLYTLYYVKQLADKENRPVFHNGITMQKDLGWHLLEDPEKWHELPAGSIVILDECQRVFRPRGTGGQVPEHVAKLETHRHDGLDLFLITQHPMLVDTNVRRLVGRHFHVQRTFGMGRATVHEFPDLRQEPDKSREGSIRHEFSYPKEVFTWYKSAEVHTVKRRIPARVLFLLSLPLILGVMVYGLVHWWSGKIEKKPEAGAALVAAPASGPYLGATSPHPITTADYLAAYVPRVGGLPHTAPVYDKVMEVRSAPQPQVCISSAAKCICYSNQGTKIDVPDKLCRQIVDNGFFDATRGPSEPTKPPQAVAALPPPPETPAGAI